MYLAKNQKYILSINLLIRKTYLTESIDAIEHWAPLGNIILGLYDTKKAPMDLYPSIPLRKFQFGLTTTSLIKLSDHGIMGLKHDTFYLMNMIILVRLGIV